MPDLVPHILDHETADDAAMAFDQLGRRISLLQAAIEGLAAERGNMPDYTDTLSDMDARLSGIDRQLTAIGNRPAMKLSPAAMTDELQRLAVEARAEEKKSLSEARNALVRALGQVDGIVLRARATQDQHRRLVGAVAGGFVAGILLWSVLPGAIARSLPESWGVPQWMAERTLGCEDDGCVEHFADKAE
ncbi:MAG: hypothetical protein ACT6R2_16625 [Blastomonas fulva]|uniref:hypothetical protein n=1 Tax=Alphaproteobacteria TaxID=28211 RepID=UPI0040342400